MRVMTILGTRPEIIRLSRIIEKLDRLCQHTLVHTGQNFDPNLNDLFFEQLGIRRPDHFMGVRGDTFGKQVSEIIVESERLLLEEKPDRLLILGDTNSGLTAFVAKRLGIAVYHLEAGNRCYDDRVPEEVNRRVIDHSSDILMPYTERSRANLLREGIEGRNIYVIGNPIWEVIKHYDSAINKSAIMQQLGVESKRYFLVTMHRAENVDVEDRLRSLLTALELLQKKYGLPIICSLHPRTKSKLQRFGIDVTTNKQIQLHSPFGLFDFISLERNAFCVLSDSGTVQEECSILKVPNVTIRDVTERPETLECGSNMLSGAEPASILRCIHTVLEGGQEWVIPAGYMVENVSGAVAKIVLGYRFISPELS
jgi:UDP-N-acetylglucosamine 2-epimerase (non-hydrolysing)